MRVQTGQPAGRLRPSVQLRTVPVTVWVLVGLQVAVLLAYSVLMPVYRAPDEPQNFDIAMATRGFSEFTGHHRTIDPAVTRSYPFAGFTQATRRAPVEPRPPVARGARPSFGDLADPPGTSMTRNQQWQHPPLYPAVVGAAVTVVTALYPPAHDWAFDQTVGFARALSVLLVAPLPLLAFLAARRLGAEPTIALAAAALPLTIPQLAHIGSAVSHDNLLILLVGLVTVGVAFVLRGDDSLRTAVVIGTLGGLALLTKGFALFLPAWIGGVYALAALRWRRWRFLAGAGLGVGIAAALGGWWWVRNLAVHGTLQPTGVRLPTPEVGFVPDFGWWVGWLAEVLPWRFWGNLGWYQAPLPGVVVAVATAALLLAVVGAFARRRPGGPGRLDLLVMAFPTVAIGGIVAYGGWGYYTETSFALGLQGRYLYPGLAGLAVLAGAGLAALPVRLARWAPAAVLAAATVMHGVAVHVILRHVYGAGSAISWGRAARAVADWSPWPAGALAANLVAVAALLAAAAVLLVRQAARAAPAPSTGDRRRPAAGATVEVLTASAASAAAANGRGPADTAAGVGHGPAGTPP